MKTDNCAPRFLVYASSRNFPSVYFILCHLLFASIESSGEKKFSLDNEWKNVPEEGCNVSIVSLMGVSHA